MKRFMIVILSFLIALEIASALTGSYIYIVLEQGQEGKYDADISIVEDHVYYLGYHYDGGLAEGDKVDIRLFRENELKSSYEGSLYSNNRQNIDDFPDKIEVIKDGIIIVDRVVNFCDLDGICEPCTEESCNDLESSLTCQDCASGSADSYCDLMEDGICDPDCEGYDADCADCGDFCYYRTDELRLSRCVNDFKGEFCNYDDYCDGERVYADDTGSQCCIGECFDVAKKSSETSSGGDVPKPEISGDQRCDPSFNEICDPDCTQGEDPDCDVEYNKEEIVFPRCGDGICSADEDVKTCYTDCNIYVDMTEECGNGLCEKGEDSKTCAVDCPSGVDDDGCDYEMDGICDPDCEKGEDPDCDELVEEESNDAMTYLFLIFMTLVIVFSLIIAIKRIKPEHDK